MKSSNKCINALRKITNHATAIYFYDHHKSFVINFDTFQVSFQWHMHYVMNIERKKERYFNKIKSNELDKTKNFMHISN